MLSDEHNPTLDQRLRHVERLHRLNIRAEYAEDWVTADWTARAIVRNQAIILALELEHAEQTKIAASGSPAEHHACDVMPGRKRLG